MRASRACNPTVCKGFPTVYVDTPVATFALICVAFLTMRQN